MLQENTAIYLNKWKSFSKKPFFSDFLGIIATSCLLIPCVNFNPDSQILRQLLFLSTALA